jgi:superfamily II DNA/RNA helicase
MNLSHIEYLILDEADKMLNLGFSEELDLILEAIPKKRQNLLFSATYPQKMLDIATKITQNPVEVTLEEEAPTVEKIHQHVIEVNPENRGPLLRYLMKKEKWKSILVFMANKRATDNIADKFRKRGYLAESFHGDLTRLKNLKPKKYRSCLPQTWFQEDWTLTIFLVSSTMICHVLLLTISIALDEQEEREKLAWQLHS